MLLCCIHKSKKLHKKGQTNKNPPSMIETVATISDVGRRCVCLFFFRIRSNGIQDEFQVEPFRLPPAQRCEPPGSALGRKKAKASTPNV